MNAQEEKHSPQRRFDGFKRHEQGQEDMGVIQGICWVA